MPILTNVLSYDALELIERLLKPETRIKVSRARKRGLDCLRERPENRKRGRRRSS
jgi:hypothetical protein